VVNLEVQHLRGVNGKVIEREVILHGGASVIVPVLWGERFVLVSQHRVAVGSYLLEFPAGTLERGEKPRACARRELAEEVRYRAGKLKKLVEIYPAPGISTEKMHLFLATNLRPTRQGKLDDDEFLEVRILAKRELERKIRRGEIHDAKTIIGFYYYQLHHGEK